MDGGEVGMMNCLLRLRLVVRIPVTRQDDTTASSLRFPINITAVHVGVLHVGMRSKYILVETPTFSERSSTARRYYQYYCDAMYDYPQRI